MVTMSNKSVGHIASLANGTATPNLTKLAQEVLFMTPQQARDGNYIFTNDEAWSLVYELDSINTPNSLGWAEVLGHTTNQ